MWKTNPCLYNLNKNYLSTRDSTLYIILLLLIAAPITAWRGSRAQIDDMTLVGIRVEWKIGTEIILLQKTEDLYLRFDTKKVIYTFVLLQKISIFTPEMKQKKICNIMKRNILAKLHEWKASSDRKPLIIRGARQVGKTTLVKQFAEEFDCFLYLNLDIAF